MKTIMQASKICAALLLFLSSHGSYAAQCSANFAHIISVQPWTDGVVYVNLDKSNNCGCAISSRFGYWNVSDPNSKTWLAMLLTAKASNTLVSIYGDTTECAKIGNTASITSINFGGN